MYSIKQLKYDLIQIALGIVACAAVMGWGLQ